MKKSTMLWGSAPIALGAALIASPAFAADAAAADSADASQVIVVTGTRIQSANLTAVSPVTTVSAQDIKISGTTRTEDLLNTLPQVYAGQTSTLSNGSTGTATVNLRDLGSSRTLVLINGRRLMTGDPASTSSAADLNFIPASLVKRVDVLTGGASATYGADAVAGVVNFVMDRDFTGLRLDGNYGVYQHNNNNADVQPILDARAKSFSGYDYPKGSVTDGGQYDATLSFGTKFGDDKGHAMAYIGYRGANPVLQQKRDYSACTIQNTGSPSPTGTTSALQCGGSSTSAVGTVFYHTAGTSSTTLTGLKPGGLQPRQRYNFAPLNYFQRPDQRYTGGAFVDYEISPAMHPYMEFMFMDDRTVAQVAPSGDFGNTLTINCDNPLMSASQKGAFCAPANLINAYIGSYPVATNASFNPNGAGNYAVPPINYIDPVTGATYNLGGFQLLRRNVEGGPRQADFEHTAFRTVIGTKGELGKAWSYDAYYQFGKVSYSQVYSNEMSVSRLKNALDAVLAPAGYAGSNFVTNAAGQKVVCRTAVTPGGDQNCIPYDVFGGTISPGALNYASATGFMHGQTNEQIASVNFVGQLGEYGIKSPAASEGATISLGGEYRNESIELNTDSEYQTGDLAGQGAPTLPVKGSYKVSEFISELNLPLVSNSFIYDLSFNGGYRYSHYSISNGHTFNTDTYKLELDFAPIKDIRVRAGFNRAVRVPNIQELFATDIIALDGVTDPCAGFKITAANTGCLAQGLHVGQTVVGSPAAQYNGEIGGNPNLTPERSNTKTLGVVLQPHWVPGLSLSADWFDIKITNAIQTYGADAILNACVSGNSTACGLIHRNPAGSLWLTGDFVNGGYVTDTYQNVGGFSTRGIELNGSYAHEVGQLGTLSFSMVATALSSLKTDNGLTPVYDCAGYYGATCGNPAPKWRHKARLALNTKQGIGLSLGWRYVGPVDSEFKNPSSTLASDYYTYASHIGGQSYFDLSMTANLGNHISWRLGVNNMLDKSPPLVSSGSAAGAASQCASVACNGNTYPGTYDALGRYIFTGVTLDF